MLVILELKRLRQRVQDFEANLGYMVRSCLKTNQKSREKKNSSKCLRLKVEHSEDIISQLLFLLLSILLSSLLTMPTSHENWRVLICVSINKLLEKFRRSK